jgi:hypothetical protein
MAPRAILVLLLVVCARNAAAQVGAPTTLPSSIPAGAPSSVQVSSVITDPRVIPTGVNVQQLDATGRVTGILGVLRDDGAAPDAAAGDSVFTGTIALNPATVGSIRIRASAALRGVLVRAVSAAVAIEVVPSDTTPPTITAAVDSPPNAAGWHRTSVTVAFTCSDADSGIATCAAPVVVTADGANQIVSGTAVDRAGNSASATVSVSVDATPPTIEVELRPSPNAEGVVTGPVTATFTCADAASGVLSCPPVQVVVAGGANQTVTGLATDRAGNTASITSPPFTISLPVADQRPIPGVTVRPTSIPSNTPTSLTVTATLTSVGDPLPGRVRLSRYAVDGQLLAELGELFDDGTHGDEAAADGTFTTTMSIAEAGPRPVLLRVSAEFADEPGAGTSQTILIPIVVADSASSARGQLADSLRGADVESAYRRLGVAFNTERLLDSLDTSSMAQVADALNACTVTTAGAGFEFCEASSPFGAETIDFEFFLFRDAYGVWRIISW